MAPPRDARWTAAWEVTERLLLMFQRETHDHQARFLLVTIGQDVQVHPDEAVRTACQRRLQVADLDYAERRLQAFGRQHGIPVLDLSRPFRAYAQQQGQALHGFSNTAPGRGHWNPAGHRYAAQLIVQALNREGLVGSAKRP
jgi:hypothetical protein